MLPTALRTTALRRTILAAPLAMLLLAGCASGSDTTPLPSGAEPPADCARVNAEGVIEISADNLEFSAPCMVANAGEPFTIHFENRESQPHNVAVYQDDSKSNEIMRGEPIITGPEATADYDVEALEAGEYYFDCSVHPDMNGTLYVVEG